MPALGEYLTSKALVHLLGYLRVLGVVGQAKIAVPQTSAEELLEGCCGYLLAFVTRQPPLGVTTW